MSAQRAPWADKACKIAPEILGKHGTVEEALPELSKTVKHQVTANALRAAFRVRGMPLPTTFLAQSHHHYDPVEDHRAKLERRNTKAENDELRERLLEAEQRQRVLDALDRPVSILKVPRREKRSGLREATAVVLASDWHVEETVDPVSVANRNAYNLTVADARIRRWGKGAQWLIGHHRQSFKIRDAVLWFGGDLITGYIHEELVETNALSPTETLIWLKPRIVREIDALLSDGEIACLTLVFSYGNHGRTTPKRRIKTGAENSFEWLLYHWLQDHYLDNDRVRVVLDKSAHQYLDVYDFSLHFHHGDEVGYGGGVGGISIPLNKRIPNWDRVRPSHYHHIGHFHQFIDLGRMMVNGSLIGYSDFAMSIGAGYEPAQQGSYLLDSRLGKTMVSPICVDEAPLRVAA
jgi:hypothetical protein